MIKERKILTKKVIVLACEGDAEEFLLGYLKRVLRPTKKFKPDNLEGIPDLITFKNKYHSLIKKYDLQNKSPNYELVFIFDNDLQDQDKIHEYILKNGHKSIQLNPNIEGFLLSLLGIKILNDTTTEEFRNKCKKTFKSRFKKEAHKLKEFDWDIIFGEGGCKLNKMIEVDQTLRGLVTLMSN